jgi:hypothetical protein
MACGGITSVLVSSKVDPRLETGSPLLRFGEVTSKALF